MMPAILNASCGQSMMGHCWWACDLSFQETAHGVPCWLASTRTCTGAAMTWPTACHIRWPLGTARSRLRCFIRREGLALCGVASGEHPGPGGGPGAALDTTPGHQPKGVGAGTPTACHLTCHQVATTGDPHPLMPTPCPSWAQLSTSHPMPGLAAPAGEWPRPPSMRRMSGRMTSKPRTCLSTV